MKTRQSKQCNYHEIEIAHQRFHYSFQKSCGEYNGIAPRDYERESMKVRKAVDASKRKRD